MNRLDSVKNAWVLGLGASGLAAVKLLRKRGIMVTAADARTPEPAVLRTLEALGVGFSPGETGPGEGADLVVTSPGIRSDGPWIAGLRGRGVPVLAEAELGWLCRGRARVLAVTGSNGKSTLVKLCADALVRAGLRAVPAGNYGLPVCEAVERGEWDWLVLELSTFQLETVDQFRPEIGILLNLYPNHLDRHGTFEAYAALKARLFARQRAGDTALVHESAAALLPGLGGGGALRLFGMGPGCEYRYAPGGVERGGRRIVSLSGTLFDNEILGAAAAAAAAALEAAGVGAGALEAAAAAFEPLPHRMQQVRELGGVIFVNDSKSTNLAALSAALRMSRPPVRLIAGGLLKESDVKGVKDLLAKKCAKVYGVGKTSLFLEAEWGGWVAFEDCRVLERAVERAWQEAKAGDTVLLSPGCASFDQFKNFEERGARFICVVQALETEKARP
ncbi:MAG: UDP-N-acetylmuramoyl-L-alanine--D-glutamate ligase [Kiritimatiellia bacterium]